MVISNGFEAIGDHGHQADSFAGDVVNCVGDSGDGSFSRPCETDVFSVE